MNRLIHSQSPYLLQHAHNPVDWYPWGEEALEKSKNENKPILLSVGYSSCHWCHVMERESFEDAFTAELMNKYFVCIKVDREERPDIDSIYMDAIQAMGIKGGWPLHAFLLPDQKPFYGGTYFPNKQWKLLIQNIADAYRDHYAQLADSAEKFTQALQQQAISAISTEASTASFSKEDIDSIVLSLQEKMDKDWGGINRKPKFAMPVIWDFLLQYSILSKKDQVQKEVFFTLEKIGMGGIYDPLRGGFARYSVDGEWFAPHFEKMLYDNGQLMALYAKAYQLSGAYFFREKVIETLQWLETEMSHPEGGFYAAQDADVEGLEGRFYTWTYDELESVAGEDLRWLRKLYNLKFKGNWEEGRNILFQSQPYKVLAGEEGISESAYINRLKRLKALLLAYRNRRTRPGLDDKILSGWNGMMVSGLLQGYLATGEAKALELAVKNGGFILEKMWTNGVLYRSYKNGQAYIPGFLEDYAHVIRALIDLYQTTFDEKWLHQAKNICDRVLQAFYDQGDGFFSFNDSQTEQLISSRKEFFDQVIPSSNAVMAHNLHDLGLFFYEDRYLEIAESMLSAMKGKMMDDPEYLCHWAALALKTSVPTAEIAILGKGALALAKEFQKKPVGNYVIAATEGVAENVPLLAFKSPDSAGNALIYVCFNKACQRPVATVEEALDQFPTFDR